MINPHDLILSVTRQCELLELPRSSYYYVSLKINVETEKVMQLIDERYTHYPHEGARKLSLWLKEKGYSYGRKRVISLLRWLPLTGQIFSNPLDTSGLKILP